MSAAGQQGRNLEAPVLLLDQQIAGLQQSMAMRERRLNKLAASKDKRDVEERRLLMLITVEETKLLTLLLTEGKALRAAELRCGDSDLGARSPGTPAAGLEAPFQPKGIVSHKLKDL